MIDDIQNQHQNSGFGMGLVIGALAGLGAYYLFGTDEGKDSRDKFVKEFHKAKKDLEKNEEFQQALKEVAIAAEKVKHEFETEEIPNAITETSNILKSTGNKLRQLLNFTNYNDNEFVKSPPKSSKRYFKKSNY